MQRIAEESISKNEEHFIIKAIKEDVRVDGRKPYDLRKVGMQFSLDDSSVTIQMGATRVLAVVTGDLEAPYQDRSREGSIRFNVELSPMASPNIDPGRPGELGVELARLMERGIKQSGALDTEALCVQPGRKVWALRVNAHVLNHAGNLIDACFLACISALVAFRLPQVSIVQGAGGEEADVVIHPPEVREPQPLSLHHLPFAISWALFEDGGVIALDPCLQEEVASQGSITFMLNTRQEICGVQKADGVGLDYDQLMRCVRLSAAPVAALAAQLQEAIKSHELKRVQARVRRKRGAGGAAAAAAAAAGQADGAGEADGIHLVALQDMDQADAAMQALMSEIEAVAAQHAMEQSSSSDKEQDEESGEEGEASSSSNDEGMAEAEDAEEQQGSRQAGRPGPRLVGGSITRQEEPNAALDALLNTKGGRGLSKRPAPDEVPSLDNLSAIADIIAGGAGAEAGDLRAAIKQKGKKRDKK